MTKAGIRFGLSLVLLIGVNAQATLSNTVKVRVRSSSNYVYPCNAGISENPLSVAKGVDYVRGYWSASEHNPRAASGAGVAVGGATSNNNADPDYATLASILTGTPTFRQYNQLLPEATQYDYVVGKSANSSDRFEINLASDTFNASYYITFCFKPSLVGDPADNVQTQLKFTSARVTHSVVTGSASNYATDAGLQAMVEVKCTKTSGSIVQHYTPGGNTSIDSLLAPFSSGTTIELASGGGILIGDGASLVYGSPLSAGVLPDECRVRFYFTETAGTMRPHATSSSDIQIDLDATVGRYGF